MAVLRDEAIGRRGLMATRIARRLGASRGEPSLSSEPEGGARTNRPTPGIAPTPPLVAPKVGRGIVLRRPTRMRSLVLALCAAFAVLLTAMPAHAHAPRRWCVGQLASYRHLDRNHATSFVHAEAPVAAPATPLRSQAPTLCSDPHQAGCRIDRPDTPRHHTSSDLHHEPIALNTSVPEVPLRSADDVTTEPLLRGGPRVATTRSPWRPPSA